MNLLDKLLMTDDFPTLTFPVKFRAKIERRTRTEALTFDVDVKGYFVGRRGKPDFVANEIAVSGIPLKNFRSIFPKDLAAVRRHALRVEFPRLIGLKDSEESPD